MTRETARKDASRRGAAEADAEVLLKTDNSFFVFQVSLQFQSFQIDDLFLNTGNVCGPADIARVEEQIVDLKRLKLQADLEYEEAVIRLEKNLGVRLRSTSP